MILVRDLVRSFPDSATQNWLDGILDEVLQSYSRAARISPDLTYPINVKNFITQQLTAKGDEYINTEIQRMQAHDDFSDLEPLVLVEDRHSALKYVPFLPLPIELWTLY